MPKAPYGVLFAYTASERGDTLQFDRKTLERLLQMNDRQLATLVQKLSEDYGVDLSALHIKEGDMASIRAALQNADDATLAQIAAQFAGGRRS